MISGNGGPAISAPANLSSSIEGTIQGNLIGTDATGTVALPNVHGITAGAQGSTTIVLTIGGVAPEAGNVISGNSFDGIGLNASAQVNLDWDRDPAPGRKALDTTLLLGLGYTW